MTTPENSKRALVAIFVLGPFLLGPSLGLFQKVDTLWSLAYLIIGSIGLACCGWNRPRIVACFAGLSRPLVAMGVGLLVFLIVIAYVWLYPLANASNATGGGSDQEEAYNVSVNAMLKGDYPYSARTYLGNPASGMPGAIFLAVPFVILGNSAYQNLFWLAVLGVTLAIRLGNSGMALLHHLTLLSFCPVVWHSLVTGNDLFANTLFVLVALQCFLWSVPDDKVGALNKILSAVFLGITMSSRSNFLLLLPMTAVYVGSRGGWWLTMRYGCVAAAVFLVITVPFWIHAPDQFGPTLKQNVFQNYAQDFPGADVIVPLASGILSLALVRGVAHGGESSYWWKCALIQMMPVLAITVMHAWSVQWPAFHWLIYGQMALVFANWAYWTSPQIGTLPPSSVRQMVQLS